MVDNLVSISSSGRIHAADGVNHSRRVSEGEIRETLVRLEDEIAAHRPVVPPEFPRETYLSYLKDVRSHIGVARHPPVSPGRRASFRRILATYDGPVLYLFNRLALAVHAGESIRRLPEKKLPSEIQDLVDRWFVRVFEDFERQPDRYYSLHNPDFVYDLSVCCMNTIPVGGAWGVHVSRAGLGPLRIGIPRQPLAYLAYLLFHAGGWGPFCVIHTFGRYFPRINCGTMDEAYLRAGELMRRNPRIKGIYRRSWMLDPALADVSPHLTYMREVPARHGARFFRCPTGISDIRGALTLSSTRRRLYELGKYHPTAYAFVWPRAAMLRWAQEKK
ncbi:MAG: hypothetical protein A2Z40_04580 [Deltaproteobacteria bacterium RBG_19FT_COMBO_60_16]|nr:MAG: hypothetical protein A2Z40_04580 [Deltaproteobacteria bacterium RBG_19FT_COMBO_60_16]